ITERVIKRFDHEPELKARIPQRFWRSMMSNLREVAYRIAQMGCKPIGRYRTNDKIGNCSPSKSHPHCSPASPMRSADPRGAASPRTADKILRSSRYQWDIPETSTPVRRAGFPRVARAAVPVTATESMLVARQMLFAITGRMKKPAVKKLNPIWWFGNDD